MQDLSLDMLCRIAPLTVGVELAWGNSRVRNTAFLELLQLTYLHRTQPQAPWKNLSPLKRLKVY